MPQPSYPYACARISALEKGLIRENVIRKMAEGSLEDAMRVLLDAHYGNMPEATPADCEQMIENVRKETVQTIHELTPVPELTDLLLLSIDTQNLKVLIKGRMLGTADVVWEDGGLFSREKLAACVDSQDYRELPGALSEALNQLEHKLKVHAEPQLVSVALDYGYLAAAMELVRDSKLPFGEDYFRALCDFNNVLTFFRLRAMGASKEDLKGMLLPVGGIAHSTLIDAYELAPDALIKALSGSVAKSAMNKGLTDMLVSGNIGMLEKERDNYLFSLVRERRHEVMSIYPIIGYYMARDREAKAVRLILTAKRNGLENSVITERLRELYG